MNRAGAGVDNRFATPTLPQNLTRTQSQHLSHKSERTRKGDLLLGKRLDDGQEAVIAFRGLSDRHLESVIDMRGICNGLLFDNEVGDNCRLSASFLISSGEITKPARKFLEEQLPSGSNRILFLDRDDIVDLCIRHSIEVPEGR